MKHVVTSEMLAQAS